MLLTLGEKGTSRFLKVFLFSLLAAAALMAPAQAQSFKKSGFGEKIIIIDGSSINSAPLYVALNQGYFRQEGLEVDCRLLPSGKAALDAVRRGEGDLATVADIPIMYAILEGAPLAIISTMGESFRELV